MLANPDNRADNEENLQNAIDHTVANLQEAEDYLDEHADEISPDEKQAIQEKNERRKHAVAFFAEEKKDEAGQ